MGYLVKISIKYSYVIFVSKKILFHAFILLRPYGPFKISNRPTFQISRYFFAEMTGTRNSCTAYKITPHVSRVYARGRMCVLTHIRRTRGAPSNEFCWRALPDRHTQNRSFEKFIFKLAAKISRNFVHIILFPETWKRNIIQNEVRIVKY